MFLFQNIIYEYILKFSYCIVSLHTYSKLSVVNNKKYRKTNSPDSIIKKKRINKIK